MEGEGPDALLQNLLHSLRARLREEGHEADRVDVFLHLNLVVVVAQLYLIQDAFLQVFFLSLLLRNVNLQQQLKLFFASDIVVCH